MVRGRLKAKRVYLQAIKRKASKEEEADVLVGVAETDACEDAEEAEGEDDVVLEAVAAVGAIVEDEAQKELEGDVAVLDDKGGCVDAEVENVLVLVDAAV